MGNENTREELCIRDVQATVHEPLDDDDDDDDAAVIALFIHSHQSIPPFIRSIFFFFCSLFSPLLEPLISSPSYWPAVPP